jgi:hypothetical protein
MLFCQETLTSRVNTHIQSSRSYYEPNNTSLLKTGFFQKNQENNKTSHLQETQQLTIVAVSAVFGVEGKLYKKRREFDSLVGALIYVKVNKGNL